MASCNSNISSGSSNISRSSDGLVKEKSSICHNKPIVSSSTSSLTVGSSLVSLIIVLVSVLIGCSLMIYELSDVFAYTIHQPLSTAVGEGQGGGKVDIQVTPSLSLEYRTPSTHYTDAADGDVVDGHDDEHTYVYTGIHSAYDNDVLPGLIDHLLPAVWPSDNSIVNDRLVTAALNADAAAVLHELSNGGSITYISQESGLTPLLAAVRSLPGLLYIDFMNKIGGIETLLPHGNAMNLQAKEFISGRDTWLWAATLGNGALIDVLADERIGDMNKVDKRGRNAIHLAAQGCHTHALQHIIRVAGISMINVEDFDGHSPLHIACQISCSSSVELLVKNGANVGRTFDQRYHGRPPCIFLLSIAKRIPGKLLELFQSESTIDNRIRSRTGLTLLQVLCTELSFHEVVGVRLIELGADPTVYVADNVPVVSWALKNGYHDFASAIIKSLGDTVLSLLNSDGASALHYACRYGPLDIVKKLLDLGGDTNVRDNDGRSPLHVSLIDKGQPDIAMFLLDHGGSNLDASTNIGTTALHYSTANLALLGITRKLIERGANVNARDSFNMSPLHTAASSGHLEVVQLLVDAGSNLNIQDDDGYSALHSAAENGHKRAIDILLSNGANPTPTNSDGDTPQALAIANGHRWASGVFRKYL